MSIKLKLLTFETLTVLLNLLFAVLTIFLILEDKSQNYLSSEITRTKVDFVESLESINREIQKSISTYIADEENISNFEFLITNQEFKESNSESLKSLYYRLVRETTRSLLSHSLSNNLDKLYLVDDNNKVVSAIDNELQHVFYIREDAGTNAIVEYIEQTWTETINDRTEQEWINRVLTEPMVAPTISYAVIDRGLYFKSVTPVKTDNRNMFWLVTLRLIPEDTMRDISEKLGIKVLLTQDKRVLKNSIMDISPELFKDKEENYWVQTIDSDEYYVSKHSFRMSDDLETASAFVTYSSATAKEQNNSVILSTITYLIVIGFFTLLILNFLVSRVIINPISDLQQKAHDIANGDLESDINVSGRDEIASLASDLSLLRDSIKSQLNQLYDSQNHLEHTVDEGTRELKEKTNEAVTSLAQLKETQAKLIELKKIERLGSIATGVSHKINTPVGVVMTANSHLIEQLKKLERLIDENQLKKSDLVDFLSLGTEYTAMIDKNMRETAKLTRSFKSLTIDKTHSKKSKFNLRETIKKVEKNHMDKLASQNVHLEIYCPQDIELYSVEEVFNSIFNIFIENALVHAFIERESGNIKLTVKKRGSQLEIIYADNGVGVHSGNLENLFDPFYTTSLSAGVGLGLSFLYNDIIQILKGQISCRSEQNKGLRFEILLPIEDLPQD